MLESVFTKKTARSASSDPQSGLDAQAISVQGADAGEGSADVGEGAFKLTKYLDIAIRKASLLAIVTALMALYFGYQTSKEVVKFKSSFRILVEPITGQSSIDALTGKETEDIELNYFTLIEVLYSPKVLRPVAEEVALQYPGVTYEQIAADLRLVRLGETTILQGAYEEGNPDRLKLILNKVAQAFLEYSIEEQQRQVKGALDFINEQLPKLKQHNDGLQGQIKSIRETYGFIDPNDFANRLVENIDTLRSQRQRIQADLESLYLQYQQLQAEYDARTVLVQSADYQLLLDEFQILEEDIAIESARFGPQHPTIQLMRRQQQNLLPLMIAEAERTLGDQVASVANEISLLEARYQSLSNASQSLELALQEMPSILQTFSELERDLSVTTANLNRFLETRKQLELQAAQNEVPWQLIAEPKPPERLPASNPIKAMMTGAIAGAALGFALAYAIEKVEDTYHNLEEIKQQKFLKVLGAIPIYPELKMLGPDANIIDLREDLQPTKTASETETVLLSPELKQQIKKVLRTAIRRSISKKVNRESSQSTQVLLQKIENLQAIAPDNTRGSHYLVEEPNVPHSDNTWLEEYDAYGFLEAFRALYLTIERQEQYRSLNSLVVTSALPQEVRTTLTVHLAQAAAAMGCRVLIVDTHLRRGSQKLHNFLGIPNQIGLSEFLQGQVSLDRIIQRLDWERGLYVMTAGQAPPDPTRLLSSSDMYALMGQLREAFDLVIYDMPPLMGLADVGLVAANSAAVVVVTSLNKRGSITALRNAVERLHLVNANMVGLVVNQVKNYKVDYYA